jgi:ribosome-associated protein
MELPDLSCEFVIKTSRSGGKGGQNVNKVSSKVELHFNIANSQIITEEVKAKLVKKLAKKITSEGDIIIVSQTDRSQLRNKKIAIEKLYEVLKNALKERKPRKATKPSKAAKEKRLKAKKIASEKKKFRSGNKPDTV